MALPIIDPAQYAIQLSGKIVRFKDQFAALNIPDPGVFQSEPLHYRMRVEFRMWHHDGRVDYAMFDPADPKRVLIIEAFPAAAESICVAMGHLRDFLQGNDVLRHRIFQVEFLATLSGELMVTLVYHRPLDERWQCEARGLANALGAQVIGRSRKQKIVLDRDWLLERFELDGRELCYKQVEGSFTQPNAGVNRRMLAWARAHAAPLGGDLLELYCGNGNFTVALAPLFDRVLATEVSKSSVHAANYNLAANGVGNVKMVRMSSDEISDAIAGGREYRRMRGVELAAYRFSTLFVDPPRSGLDAVTLDMAGRFDRILYISCNPATLRENVEVLQSTHQVTAAAVFDQFPYTAHLEAGLLLTRR